VDATPIQPQTAIEPVLQQARKAKRIFASLAPRQHIGEFEHLRLMADLREFHVRFKKLEREIQSAEFTTEQIPQKARTLERLMEESEMLDHRFIRANRGFLYEKALAEEIEARSKKLHRLYDRLTRSGRTARKVSVALLGLQRRWSWWNGAKRPLSRPARAPLQSPTSQ
jgi:hexosaminidase